LTLRAANDNDIEFVLATEADPDASPFVIRWSRAQHANALTNDDQATLIIEQDGTPVSFVLLAGLSSQHRSVELRRIIVERKGCGLGRQALRLVLAHIFEALGAHRVWLDVKIDNERAQRADLAAGFVREGVLRDALLTDGRYESLIVMSVLQPEGAAESRAPASPGRERSPI
jgi:RimJ/RimL family protein N-acetyltransferase